MLIKEEFVMTISNGDIQQDERAVVNNLQRHG